MSVTLTKVFEFTASHSLMGMVASHECAKEHSHDYRLELTLTGDLNNGLVVDTGRLKIDVTPVIKRIKGRNLNALTDSAPWSIRLAAQPSVEHLAMYFWDALQFINESDKFRLIKVTVYESPMIWASYQE